MNKAAAILSAIILSMALGAEEAFPAQTSSDQFFSAQVESLFPDRDFLSCVQGHFEPSGATIQNWYIRTPEAGEFTVDVIAKAVNTVEESGSITARLYSGQSLLGEVTVAHPSGQGASNGDENKDAIGPLQVAKSATLRLEITRGAATGTPGEARHYKLGFSDIGGERVTAGVGSPTFKYFEGGPQVFHVGVDNKENFRLALLGDEDPHAPQATSATIEVKTGRTGEVVIAKTTIAIPYTLAADNLKAGALIVDISEINGHYRVDKQSGSDRGIYLDACPFDLNNGPQRRLIPIVDAHSQADDNLLAGTYDADGDGIIETTGLDLITSRMADNGVTHTILAPRKDSISSSEVLDFAADNPDEITPAVMTKTSCYTKDGELVDETDPDSETYCERDYGEGYDYEAYLSDQLALSSDWGGMAEVLLYHAAKTTSSGGSAPKIVVDIEDEKVQLSLDEAKSRGWPFIPHIEFAAIAEDEGLYDFGLWFTKLTDMLEANPDHPFAMIHMGQLGSVLARYLIENYDNINFLTSHSNHITITETGEPWVDMFDATSGGGYTLKSEWKTLINDHPDRFIFNINNVNKSHWFNDYEEVVSLWREGAFAVLPLTNAHALAHCNAERLWNLPPQGGSSARLRCAMAEVQRIVSNGGLSRALMASLSAARSSLGSGNNEAALGQLGAFLNKVAAQAGKQITQDGADRLTGMVQGIVQIMLTGTSYIDTHAHIGPDEVDGTEVDSYTDGVADALATMDDPTDALATGEEPDYTISMSLLMTGGTDWTELDAMAAIADANPDKFAVMGGGGVLGSMIEEIAPAGVTILNKAVFRSLAIEVLQKGNIVGFGEMFALHLQLRDGHPYLSNEPDHPFFLLLADIAAAYDVPIDLHMEAVPHDDDGMDTPTELTGFTNPDPPGDPNNPSTLSENIPALEALLEHNPEAKIVWVHAGWDNTGKRDVDLMRRLLGDHPNLYMSIKPHKSNLTGYPNRPVADTDGDGELELNADWLSLITEFSRRFMIGSDAKYEEDKPGRFTSINAVLDGLPFFLRRQVAYMNAYRVYKLRTRLICHDFGSWDTTMRVTVDQVADHLDHGDTPGPCDP